MVGLVDRGYRPHRSAVIERIDRVLSDAEQSNEAELPNDIELACGELDGTTPAGQGRRDEP